MSSNLSASEEYAPQTSDSEVEETAEKSAKSLSLKLSQPLFVCTNHTKTPLQIVLLNKRCGSNTKWITSVTYWIAMASSTTNSPSNPHAMHMKLVGDTNWKMMNQYRVGPFIGKGSYSVVRKVEDVLNDRRIFAMRFFLLHMCIRTRAARFSKQDVEIISEFDKILDEVLLLDSLHHPNICHLEEVYLDYVKGYLYMIVEYVPFRCLTWNQSRQAYYIPRETIEQEANTKYMAKNSRNSIALYSEYGAKHILMQLIHAVEYIHSFGIIHKDIKPENFLLDKQIPLGMARGLNVDFVIFVELKYEDTPVTDDNVAVDQVNEACSDTEESEEDFTDSWLWEDSPLCSSEESFLFARSLENSTDSRHETTVANAVYQYYRNAMEESDVYSDSDQTSHECVPKSRFLAVKSTHEEKNLEPKTITPNPPNLIGKLIDFNTAVVADSPDYLIWDSEGTRHFTPPECLSLSSDESGIKGKPRDMWSIGCTLHCLIFGQPPFNGTTAMDLLCAISSNEYVLPHYRSISEDLKHLLRETSSSSFSYKKSSISVKATGKKSRKAHNLTGIENASVAI
ncbi:atypical MEK-related kinase (incomplete catalytic triad) [Cardiosporidium cionae]|uniref:Atypical MEK-related kinase (Incomplete catalytic triad) n=1 Tax=Cardiosporidium cionae TaxID=476202 RepID=A0ABQ7J5D6_9APIC|nr:atypical MEK-related kinase (incomplete catalytic triad) [Cardiosporidium cionae]|eukprot:KAF8819150.1 atypical MEK-related kinase (incomplete catalytic triad) [Cardiosporidium cionae]